MALVVFLLQSLLVGNVHPELPREQRLDNTKLNTPLNAFSGNLAGGRGGIGDWQ